MRQRIRKWAPLLLMTAWLLTANWAQARVGGGQSYSGGHSSSGGGYSGGGSSGGSGDLFFLVDIVFRLLQGILWLTFHHPLIGIPLDCVIFYVAWVILTRTPTDHELRGVSYGDAPTASQIGRAVGLSLANNQLEELKNQLDPGFSKILLMDFLHSLYASVQHARGQAKLTSYAGYLSPATLKTLQALSPGLRTVEGVVIGQASVVRVSSIQKDQPTRLTVEFEANYTETRADGTRQSYYAKEFWQLSRGAQVQSREPARVRQITCPSCGAPPAFNEQGVCPACGTQIRSGQFDWFVDSVDVDRSTRPPLLTSNVEEEGTDLPTLVSPGFAEASTRIQKENPDFNWERLSERASLIFTQLQKAWTLRKWEEVRPFESDNIFESHSYWLAEYKRQKLVNVIRDVRIQKMIPVKIAQDRYYSAITFRIYASMLDYTQTEDGKPVTGSASSPRAFSEYWTFMRGRSAQKPKKPDSNLNCPACGAALKVNMAGNCEYCQAKITTGDFDWVLSSIEQDEAYPG